MKRVQPVRHAIVIIALIFAPAVAHAQARVGPRISRPSEGAASTRVGQVGGAQTRGADTSRSLSSPSNTSATDFRLPNFDANGIGQIDLGRPIIPQAFQPIATGYFPRLLELSDYARTGLSHPGDAARLSDLNGALSNGVPFEGYEPKPLLQLGAGSYYARPTIDTPFHKFFGLREEDAKKTGTFEFESRAAFLENENREYLDNSLNQAKDLFKDATKADPSSRSEKMSRAMGLLIGVRDIDRAAATPCVILAQIYLERGEVLLASRMLLEAIRRDPNLFVSKFDVAGLYGDRSGFESLARRYFRIGDEMPAAESYVIQAYATWLAGDAARTREAVERLIEQLKKESNAKAQVFAYAMKATLE